MIAEFWPIEFQRSNHKAGFKMEDYTQDIADVLSDSFDMDWTANDGARAIIRWLDRENLVITTAYSVDD
jgi:hypothetical protein